MKLRRQLAEEAEDKALAEEMSDTLKATAEAEVGLCRLEAERAAFTELMKELQAQLHAADRDLGEARARAGNVGEEYLKELTVASDSVEASPRKRRRLLAAASAAPPRPLGGAAGALADPVARLVAVPGEAYDRRANVPIAE